MAGKKRNPSDDFPVLTTGDADPFTYGGGVVYYQPEYDKFLWVFWDEPLEEEYPEIEDAVYRVHQFRYAPDVDLFGPQGELSWAADELKDIARSMGMEASELRRLGRGNFIEQHVAADAVRRYWGAENLDHEPFEESHRDLLKRYEKDHEKALKLRVEQALRRVESLRMGRRVDRGRNPSHRANKTSRKKTITYYYRGQIEVPSRGGYRWADGYSATSPTGGVLYPWMTKAQARKDAKEQGAVAEFVEERSSNAGPGTQFPIKSTVPRGAVPARKLKNRLMR